MKRLVIVSLFYFVMFTGSRAVYAAEPYKTFHANGQIEIDAQVKDGHYIGVYKEYDDEGNLWRRINYAEDGVLDGSYTVYYNNGNVKYETDYENNEIFGREEFYYRDGELYSERYLDSINAKGIERKFFPTGSLFQETQVDFAKEQLRIQQFTPMGETMLDIVLTEDGILDSTGQKIEESSHIPFENGHYFILRKKENDNEEIFMSVFGPDGNPVVINSIDSDFTPTGSREFYPGGKIASEIKLGENLEFGSYTRYYENGQKAFEGKSLEGMLAGLFIEFYENGELRSIGNFYNNKLNGKNVLYSENRTQIDQRVYYYGRLLNSSGENYEGEYTRFHTDGKTAIQESYKDGYLDGELKHYYSNGNTALEGHCVRSRCDLKAYWIDGSLRSHGEVDFINLSETMKYYNFEGKMIRESHMSLGEPGYVKYYTPQGELIYFNVL